MRSKRELLWVADAPIPEDIRRAIGRSWEVTAFRPDAPLREQTASRPLTLVYPNGWAGDTDRLGRIAEELASGPAVAVFLLPAEERRAWDLLAGREGPFVCVEQGCGPEELAARLHCAADLQPAISALRARAGSAGDESGRGADLTEEMRLAARLQRDFLPSRLPEVGAARFGVLFRPATWVSGDLYDVVRLDETHVGFYIADAVGHGLPAALLTMFIKHGLQTKRIVGNTYEILPPHVSFEGLNRDICEQNLSDCQFCTAVYCVLDTADNRLTFSRAGHPDPVVIHPDGGVEPLACKGSLLGVFPEETYESRQVQLSAGDRVVLYSDGAERALFGPDGPSDGFREALAPWAGVPREEMVHDLTERVDRSRSAGEPDDATIVVMDVGE